MPNNPDLVSTSINISPQQLIIVIANILPTIDAPVFADPMGEFFRILELEFPVNNFEKPLGLTTFFQQKDETVEML
jgi:hypothetical protein